ncbi:MAG: hypothetical protein J6331_02575, partial [Lentisphaeria bacterium]|nr:hypothetical protein [Lentisphaeria bacterium]
MKGTYEKGIWIELIGFDREKKDFGVKEFLGRMKEKPSLISLLLFSTQILHAHTGLEKNFYLGDLQCSYYGRSFNEERKRQKWTAYDLRGLADELHQYGIKVIPSFFDVAVSEKTARDIHVKRAKNEWTDEHPEVMYFLPDGKRSNSIFPLKTLSSGQRYADFFVEKLLKFLKDYHFDGFHGCDGFGHPRFALGSGDFSKEMLERFSVFLGKKLPELPREKLVQYILTSLRKQWSLFHASEHALFWMKTASALKKEGFFCILNTAWTRDPFEALFRYGIDYRLLAKCPIDGFFAEASSSVLELEGWNDTESSCLEKCQAMLLRTKAFLPETKIRLLGCIKDGMEQYSALRHGPCRMRSEAYTLYNLFCNGKRCAEGVLECLGDGITSAEWKQLDDVRLLAAKGNVFSLPCAHVFQEESAFDREFDFYASSPEKERYASSHTLLHELIHAGAVLPSVVTFGKRSLLRKNLSPEKDPLLLVLHPAFLSPKAKKFLDGYSGMIAFFGLMENGESLALIRKGKKILFREEIHWKESEKSGEEPSWLWRLPEKSVAEKGLFARFAESLNLFSSFVLPETEKKFLRVWGFFSGEKQFLLFARNEKTTYLDPAIRIRGKVKNCRALSEDPSRSAMLAPCGEKENETLLRVRIPPCGTVVLKLELS